MQPRDMKAYVDVRRYQMFSIAAKRASNSFGDRKKNGLRKIGAQIEMDCLFNWRLQNLFQKTREFYQQASSVREAFGTSEQFCFCPDQFQPIEQFRH